MKKFKIICAFILIMFCVGVIVYCNYDRILNYFTNKEWEIAGSAGKIELSNYLKTCCTNSNFIVVESDSVRGYSDNTKEHFDKVISAKDVLTHSAGEYLIISEKDGSNVTCINGEEIAWTGNINNASVLAVYVNKNGYSAVIYSQSGYKTLIKVFSSTGEELFTNYLASTYAIDVAISNDNKNLAIAEVDTEGISVKSRIKLVDIKEATQSNVKKYELESNEVITDIDYNQNNELIIMTNESVKMFDGEIKNIVNFKENNVTIANIDNQKNIITVETKNESLFNALYELCIYDVNSSKGPKTYELEDVPMQVVCNKNIIAINTGEEIIFLNSSGNFQKKCEYKGQLKDICLFGDGETAVLVFRDNAEFIKIGGI